MTPAAAAACVLGPDDLELSGRAGAECLLDERVALAGGVACGHDLDRGHARSETEDRECEREQDRERAEPEYEWVAPEPFSPAGEGG